MKSSEQMTKEVLRRIEECKNVKRQRQKRLVRTVAPLVCVCLISALFLGLYRQGRMPTPVETVLPTTETSTTTATTSVQDNVATEPAAATDSAEQETKAYSFTSGAIMEMSSQIPAGNTLLTALICEATGLNITWHSAPESEGISALMTGEQPVSLVFTEDVEAYNKLGRYGAVVNLLDYKNIMPNFFGRFYSDEYAQYRETFLVDENILYVAPVLVDGSAEYSAWIYREDIFRQLNLDTPKNWDSFYKVLKALKAAYPDSHPFAMQGLDYSLSGLREFAQQFGVDYSVSGFSVDADGAYYDPSTTDEMRNLITLLRQLIEEELLSTKCLGPEGTAYCEQSMADGTAFITYVQSSQLQAMEAAGQTEDPKYTLSWFNNIPMIESDLPYTVRVAPVQKSGWVVFSKARDIELTLRFLDWLYSEEGMTVTSWGKEGVTYGVDADGDKYYLDSFMKDEETLQQFANDKLSGNIDFNAVLAKYSPKNREMILDTVTAVNAGGFCPVKEPELSGEEKEIVDTYLQAYLDTRSAYLLNYLIGGLDIRDDDAWQRMKSALIEKHVVELLAAYSANEVE